MTASVIKKLRSSRGENTWLEDLKAGSTESFVEEIRGLLEDPEWEFGPARLVSSYLTGPTKYVLAEKEGGTVLRVRIEGEATEFKLGEVELREIPDSIPTLGEEVMRSAGEIVDHLFNEDKDLDVEGTLVAISEAVRLKPDIDKEMAVQVDLDKLGEENLWYAGQLPPGLTSKLSEDSAADKALSVLKGRVASVIESLKDHGDVKPGFAVIIESVFEHSDRAIRLLSTSLDEGDVGRKALRVMSSVPTIDKALAFIQNELSEDASETVDQEAEIQ